MSFQKIRTILVSERVFSIATDTLNNEIESMNPIKVSGYLECFNNCREQGYVLATQSYDYENEKRTKESLYIWAFENRSSDNIVVCWQTEYPDKGMYSILTFENRRKLFKYNELQSAADFIVELVKKHFKVEFSRQ